ncbi:decaprenyl-phosphate phosphoribosyltransferase [Pelotalea chapellei]|uniref:Decaprenyl-phosphate phosphoribosyltransferase n=1 Tax=Pelotalea chapellei TaxID=44671 RepID=A0ABS5U7Y3_9BACT|nr:decaprenyl-phosphate phosphoribosyltransferase [Pelotalea chapellei]MBT1071761.1 decaprenyl-phosphate phosphoribosyltransferase [Pelotalea chapellei]
MHSFVPYIQLLRPRQWLKNLMLYFPPFLGGTLLQSNIAAGILPLAIFCMVSSAIYIINDILDISNDSHHPEKCNRPLPTGRVSIPAALLLAICLISSGISLASAYLPASFMLCLALYILISLAYTFKLKEYALIDLFCISSGFMLRLKAGGVAFNVTISEWLFLTVFLLSFFLSTGKRFSEKKRLGATAVRHRKVLDMYPRGFLQGLMCMSAAAVLVTYAMYAISKNSSLLLYTVPLCCFGLMRYMIRIQSGSSGDPTESLLKDGPLFATGLVWAIMVGWGIYGT